MFRSKIDNHLHQNYHRIQNCYYYHNSLTKEFLLLPSAIESKMSSKEKNYKCDYCKKRFRRENDFLKHVRILYQTTEDFSCELCSKVFTSSMSLKKHKWKDFSKKKMILIEWRSNMALLKRKWSYLH